MWALGMFISTGMNLPLGLFYKQASKHSWAYIYMYMHIHTQTYFRNHEVTPIHPTPIHPHKVICCLSPSIFAGPIFHGENSGSQHHGYIYSFAQSYTTSKIVFRIASCLPIYKTSLPKHFGICLQLTSSPPPPHASHAQDWGT